MFCLNCGKEIADNATFCPACGQRVGNSSSSDNSSTTTDATSEILIDYDVECLIGEKSEYYIRKFKLMKQTGKKTSWNWCSFLFSTLWFVYRKMYLYAFILFLVGSGLSYISSYLSFAVTICAGIFGNYIYMTHLESLAKEANLLDSGMKEQFIKKKSGVNLAAVIVIAIVYVILLFLISFVIAFLFAALGMGMY